jgi:GntR family transcriptional repressor for pyruvate dehydrogenase complex
VPFSPLNRLPAYQQVAEQIREAIEREELRQGEPLPTEHALALEFGVSRTTIREALKALRSQGLVQGGQSAPFRTIVASGSNVLERAFAALVAEGSAEGPDLVDLQSCIESGAVHRGTFGPAAPWPATSEALDALRDARAAVEADPDELAGMVDAYRSFHLSIVEAIGNELMTALMRAIQRQLASESRAACEFLLEGPDASDRLNQFVAFHQALLDALEDGDSSTALQLLRSHEYEFFSHEFRRSQADLAGS